MRLIDADALQNEFKKRHIGSRFTLIDIAPTIIPEQRWIPCSKQLPDQDGDYLVWYEDGYRQDYGFNEIGIEHFEVDHKSFIIRHEYFDLHTMNILGSSWFNIKVIAWMPLPKPYKEDDNEIN